MNSSAAGPSANHSPLLDFLRAGSAFLVLLGHTRNWFFSNIGAVDQPGPLLKLFWLVTVLEHEGVVIFFILSGFLVGGHILNGMARGSFNLVGYLSARFARIYIVYVPALIVTGLVFTVGRATLQDFGGDTIRPLFAEAQPYFGGLRGALCHLAGLQGFSCPPWRQIPCCGRLVMSGCSTYSLPRSLVC